MTPAIEAHNLSKRYVLGRTNATVKDVLSSLGGFIGNGRTPKETFWALEDVSFEVAQGEALGIIGRNGAGKSTTLKIMSRITRPTSGHVTLRGRVGSLLEVGTGFHPELSGRENILLNGAILGMNRAEIESKFERIVEFAGLSEFIDTPVKRYSTGMSMRLAFSVAAHLEPEIMLVDEVLAVGDQEFQRKCLGRMGELQHEGRTVVLISHNMGAIQRVCSRAVLLEGGKVAAVGPTAEVVQTYHRLTSPAAMEAGEVDSEVLSVSGWELRSPSAVGPYVIKSGAPCEFVFHMHLPEDIDDAFIGVAVYTSDGTLATSVSTLDLTDGYVDMKRGSHEVGLDFDSLPLGPGQYSLYLSLNSKRGKHIESWTLDPPFEILRKKVSVQVPPPWEGIVSLEPRLEIR